MSELNTPEKVDDWLLKNFSYDRHELVRRWTTRWTSWEELRLYGIDHPIEVYYKRKGVCDEAANFACYALNKAGYKVHTVTAFRQYPAKGPRDIHTVCAVKVNGKWWISGDTNGFNTRGPFTKLKDLAYKTIHERERPAKFWVDKKRKGW
jgi:hypothetical protein